MKVVCRYGKFTIVVGCVWVEEGIGNGIWLFIVKWNRCGKGDCWGDVARSGRFLMTAMKMMSN